MSPITLVNLGLGMFGEVSRLSHGYWVGGTRPVISRALLTGFNVLPTFNQHYPHTNTVRLERWGCANSLNHTASANSDSVPACNRPAALPYGQTATCGLAGPECATSLPHPRRAPCATPTSTRQHAMPVGSLQPTNRAQHQSDGLLRPLY